jgi:uncharacterized protein (TIGR01777 family)
MKIVIAGGTGFLGRPLSTALAHDGHDVVVLTRRSLAPVPPGTRAVAWDPQAPTGSWVSEVGDADAVVNLTGEPIADHRWTRAQKIRIEKSRVEATARLVTAIRDAARPPSVLVSGSGVGFYGPRGSEIVTEETPAGGDFLAQVCQRWEAEAGLARSAQTRVVCIRTGLVLDRDGGALPKMLPPFRFGAGGPLGDGQQYWPWIHLKDWVDLARTVLVTPAAAGAFNASAPAPVTNAEFAAELGRALHRPAFMPAPGFALRLLLGEMATALLLSGQRAVPAKAERLGFRFTYPTLAGALGAIFPQAGSGR